ncbi:MAG: hypothetical protein JWM10_638 [Myxococcaceae bacterium]|nr:hypothetical protein [Myxococcaceae bacterium]
MSHDVPNSEGSAVTVTFSLVAALGMPNKPMVPTAPTAPITNPLHPMRWHIGQPLGRPEGPELSSMTKKESFRWVSVR